MNIEIGSYEAKTKLPELLRGVQEGNRYTITLRGAAIADLIPSAAAPKNDVALAIAQMYQFMEAHSPILGIDTKALLEEGRD
ncbi:type II toxin-antitoxin system Phd/YefM family antitoxin [Ampullimonas aquatilis]|uniref:type II toxin-antitoxin system Phd/YefM family antitoxin n=1 Tax=Ampullimonas aquatilis TaxID=1341549 RepID=UPI003C78A759